MDDPKKKKKKSNSKSKTEKGYQKQIEDLKNHITQLESLIGESMLHTVAEVIPTGCGFAPEAPQTEMDNDGNAILIVRTDGSYDVICSYYNGPCRHSCQIMKTIMNSEQNQALEDYNMEEEIEDSLDDDFGEDD